MSKLSGQIVLLSGLILLFTLFGLTNESSSLVAFLLNPTDYTNSQLFIQLSWMVAIITGAGVVSYFVSSGNRMDFAAVAGMVGVFMLYIKEILSIFSALASNGTGGTIIGAIVISPMIILYIVAVVEWWRGVG
jgi:hypothetical protein